MHCMSRGILCVPKKINKNLIEKLCNQIIAESRIEHTTDNFNSAVVANN